MKNSIESVRTNKQFWTDYAKGIAIILVVLKHTTLGLDAYAGIKAPGALLFLHQLGVNFRMPLFFVVSGVFAVVSLARHSPLKNVENKFKTIFYPYLLWSFIQISLQIAFPHTVSSRRSMHDYLYIFTEPRRLDQFWYLATLFYVSVVFTFLYVMCRKKVPYIMALSFAIGLPAMIPPFYPNSILQDAAYFLVFFAIGFLISRQVRDVAVQDIQLQKKYWILLLPVFLATLYFDVYDRVDNYVLLIVLRTINILTGIYLVFVLSVYLSRKNTMNWLKVTGQHSMVIYLTHLIVIGSLRELMLRMGVHSGYVLSISLTVLSIVVPITGFWLAKKWGFEWLFRLTPAETRGKQKTVS